MRPYLMKSLLFALVVMLLVTSLSTVFASESDNDGEDKPRDRNENGHDGDDQKGGEREGAQIRKTPRDRDSQ